MLTCRVVVRVDNTARLACRQGVKFNTVGPGQVGKLRVSNPARSTEEYATTGPGINMMYTTQADKLHVQAGKASFTQGEGPHVYCSNLF